jgi:LacI family transcriptional regulator
VEHPTLKEVAQRAGVHPATASRALNEATRSMVRDDTAEKVQAIAAEMGYFPNPIARSLKTARTASIGVILPDLTHAIFPPIVRGIEDVLREAGYSTLIVNTDDDPAREEQAVEVFRQRSVEGFILATAHLQHPLLERMTRESVPMVLVNRRARRADISSVAADEDAGIMQAVDHLHALGHRDFVHLAGPQHLSTGLFRRQAFKQRLDELGLRSDRIAVCDAYTEEAGARAMSGLLDAGESGTAVVAANDLIALGCYKALREHGLSCPNDVSVVGFNDMPMVDHVSPPLTTLRIPCYELGAESARTLLEMLKFPGRHPRSLLFGPALIERASTGPAAPRRRTGLAPGRPGPRAHEPDLAIDARPG